LLLVWLEVGGGPALGEGAEEGEEKGLARGLVKEGAAPSLAQPHPRPQPPGGALPGVGGGVFRLRRLQLGRQLAREQGEGATHVPLLLQQRHFPLHVLVHTANLHK